MCVDLELCEPDRESSHACNTQDTHGKSVMGICWAVPVRPDRLGYQLSVFDAEMKHTYLPLQRFLKYAQKPGNACARLPAELIRMITELVLDSENEDFQVDERRWLQGYLCSQRACQVCQHVSKEDIEAYAYDFDQEFGRNVFDCGQPYPWEERSDYDSSASLTSSQDRFIEEGQNSDLLAERGGGTRVHDDDYKEQITSWILDQEEFSVKREHSAIVKNWLELFDQSPGGHFSKLDKVCASSLGALHFLD